MAKQEGGSLVNPQDYLKQTYQESISVKEEFFKENGSLLVAAAELMGRTIKNGRKILILGNGGSAADAQHMAAEMVGRMLIERRPLPAIALTTDTSNLTAVGNDYGFDQVFVRQVRALAQKGDLIIAISTSGKSKNVLMAVEEARSVGCSVIGLTGGSGNMLKKLSDICLCATRGKSSSRIQETHIFAIHSMVDLLDRFYLDEKHPIE